MDFRESNFSGGARVAVRTQSHVQTAVRVYGYGDDQRVPNPGDLLLVLEYGSSSDLTEIAVLLRGRDMKLLKPLVDRAVQLREENEDWLSAPVTRLIDDARDRLAG